MAPSSDLLRFLRIAERFWRFCRPRNFDDPDSGLQADGELEESELGLTADDEASEETDLNSGGGGEDDGSGGGDGRNNGWGDGDLETCCGGKGVGENKDDSRRGEVGGWKEDVLRGGEEGGRGGGKEGGFLV